MSTATRIPTGRKRKNKWGGGNKNKKKKKMHYPNFSFAAQASWDWFIDHQQSSSCFFFVVFFPQTHSTFCPCAHERRSSLIPSETDWGQKDRAFAVWVLEAFISPLCQLKSVFVGLPFAVFIITCPTWLFKALWVLVSNCLYHFALEYVDILTVMTILLIIHLLSSLYVL